MPRRRHLLAPLAVLGALFVAACGDENAGLTSRRSTEQTPLATDTAATNDTATNDTGGTGSGDSDDCDLVLEHLDTPVVTTTGATVDATLLYASLNCGDLNADGTPVFGEDPDLLEAEAFVGVETASDDGGSVSWDGPGAFATDGSGTFTLDDPGPGCWRLQISLESPTGLSTAEFVLDVRFGGDAVPCDQRKN